MKKISLLFLILLIFSSSNFAQNCSDCGKLAIGGLMEYGSDDAYLFCTTGAIEDLSIYSLHTESSSFTNTDYLNPNFTFPPISLPADTCFWVTDEMEADFINFFGFDALLDETDFNDIPLHSGFYSVYILCGGNIDDLYGDGNSNINDVYSYDKGFALSNTDRCPNGGVFDPSNWTISEDATDGASSISEVAFPLDYDYNGNNCAPTNVCGGLELCMTDVFFSCSDDVYTVSIPYSGSESTAVVELEVSGSSFTANSDDPTTVADGVLEIQLASGGANWGVTITTENGCVITRFGPGPGAGSCAEQSCLWSGLQNPECSIINNSMSFTLSPFGAGIGTMGYTVTPNSAADGTLLNDQGTYGTATTFTISGDNIAFGDSFNFNITDNETGCVSSVVFFDECPDSNPSCSDGIQNGDEEGIDCGGSCPNTCFDCPDLMANVGDMCDDGDPNTSNDTVQSDCTCAGQGSNFDCPDLMANVGDMCDDGDPNTSNDTVQNDCTCAGQGSNFDCPDLMANVGDVCDDGDDTTTNDTVQADCSCVGNAAFDCPDLMANVGDACDDGDDTTNNDSVQADCSCAGALPGECSLNLPDIDLQRQGALYGPSDFPIDGNEVYTWYNEFNQLVAQIIGNPYYSPSSLGTYTLVVTDPDYPNCSQASLPRTITSLNGCCELDDE